MTKGNSKSITLKQFHNSFRILIIATWILPAVVGLSFILAFGVLSVDQMLDILLTPLEPAYIIGWVAFALWYFLRYTKKLENYIADDNPSSAVSQAALDVIQNFPFRYWSLFLIYLIAAPASVIWSAEYYTDYVASPVDWFRIELIALISSIIVGLPIFFLILDLFGRSLGNINLLKPHITIKTKVFLIGALVPLLIDTILVQYYWTRTGLFTYETFFVWLALELLAVGASLIFARSFSRSLLPLEGLFTGVDGHGDVFTDDMVPASTDEIGVLTVKYRQLLDDLNVAMEVLEIRNRVLRDYGKNENLGEVADAIITFSQNALKSENVMLMVIEDNYQQLICVAQSGHAYHSEGHFRLDLDDLSLAALVYNSQETHVVSKVHDDQGYSSQMVRYFDGKSALACPLLVEGESIGVLIAANSFEGYEYNVREISLLEGVAAETALIFRSMQLQKMHDSAVAEKQEREARISLLMDFTEEGIFGVDLDGICTFMNRSALLMLGYDDEGEILGLSIHERIHHTRVDGTSYPKELCSVRLATLARTSGRATDEVHWRRDGTSFPVEYWSHPLRRNGEVVGTVVTFIDITERLIAEQELSSHRENLEQLVKERTRELEWQATIIGQIHDSVVSTDLQGVITYWNRGAERLFGYSQKEAKGRHISFVYPEEEHEFLQNFVIDVLLEKGEHEAEVRMRKKSGEDFFAHLSLSMHNDDSGEPVGMIGYSMDISERKLAEQNLARKATELEAANEELESFSYSVSHDLRAPLRAIDGFSLALMEDYEDVLDETGKDFLLRVRNGTQRMGLLIDDILELSRVARTEFSRETVHLSRLADLIIQRLQLQDKERQVVFEVEEGLSCTGDEHLIEIMLENLLVNAWKYTALKESATIKFSKYREGDREVFFIQDNGAGFDMKYVGKLFKAFQRLHNAADFQGSGIGLAIVQRIINRHGGDVWAEAKESQGATFFFSM